MNLNLILGVGIAAIVLYYLLKALSRPILGLGKVFLRSAAAFCVIWAANVAGASLGFHLGLNLVSALVIGVLGIPGAALLLAVKYFI